MKRNVFYIRCLSMVLLSLLGLLHGSAEDLNLTIHRLGISDGLRSATINCITQDAHNFIFMGARDGLYRYDGNRFYFFKQHEQNDIDPADGYQVHSVALQDEHTVWLSKAHNLYVLDTRTERLERITAYDGFKEGTVDNLYIDRQGQVWGLTISGIKLFNAQTHKRLHLKDSTMVASDILETASGEIWLSVYDGKLYRYNRKHNSFFSTRVCTDKELAVNTVPVAIAECRNGLLAVATNTGGVKLFNPATNQVSTLFTTDDKGQKIFIHTLISTEGHLLWIGTERGIYIYDIDKGYVAHLEKSYTNANSLSDNAVHVLSADSEGNVWAGTFFGGANVISRSQSFLHNLLPVGTNGQVQANIIRQIVNDQQGHLWIGTEDNGLTLYDMATGKYEMMDCRWQGEPISTNIQGMALVGRHLYVGTFNGGLFVIDVSTRQVVRHINNVCAPGGQHSDMVVCMESLGADKLFLGTNASLYIFDCNTGKITEIEGANGHFIHAMCTDTQGNLWLGTLNDGLYLVTHRKDKWKVQLTPFPYHNICAVYEDSHHRLWVGTEGYGLCQYRPQDKSTSRIKLMKEEGNSTVCRIEEDARGYLWISTFDGLYCYNPKQGQTVSSLDHTNGITNSHFNFASSYHDPSGNLYFGSYGGLVTFDPTKFDEGSTPLRVFFTGMNDGTHSLSLVENPLKISYNTSLTLYYSVPTYANSKNIWYRYRIKGDDWTLTTTATPIQFARLSPGTYTLEIQASYTNGEWNGEPTTLTIRVTPPWWSHPLAYLLYFLIIVALIGYAFWRYRRRTRLEHAQQMQQLQVEKDKEILQSKIDFFTTITHEIRTPLTLIMGSIEKLNELGQQSRHFKLLRNNAQRLLDLVNQLLDFRKIESQQLHMNFSDIDLSALLRTTCDNFQPLASQRGVEMTVNIPQESLMVVADRESAIKMVSNMLSNALKFSEHTVSVTLQTIQRNSQQLVQVCVKNDGVRIPLEKQEEIFRPFVQYYDNNTHATIKGSGLGLSLTRSLAEMHTGRFYYDNQEPTLNSFILELPALGESNPEPDNALESPTTVALAIEPDAIMDNNDSPTLLIVDDETDLRQFVADELAQKYKVLQANDGQEALQLLEQHAVALIITDLMMPVMDGMEFCQRLKQDARTSHIPVIVLTAKVSLQDHIDVLNAHADAYIEKPFTTQHLMAQISNLIHSRQLLRDLYVHSPYVTVGSITTNQVDNDFITRMDEFINPYIDPQNGKSCDALTVDALAQHMAMSTPTLYRKVKALTDLSPKDYIQLRRLKQAAKMLKEGHYVIKEVSDTLGFSSPSYFTKCFMKQFGITPGDFMQGRDTL